MKREEVLSRFFETYLGSAIEAMAEAIRKHVEANVADAREDALRSFSALCENARAVQAENRLGALVRIDLSFLRVGLADRKGLYRMDACDETWLVSGAPCVSVWDAKFAFDPFFECVQTWKKKARVFGGGLREVDLDSYIAMYSMLPRIAADTLLAGLAPAFGAHPAYEALCKTEGCAITLGEYRDAQTVVFPVQAESGGGK
jgi:hypothetical protein